MSDGKDYPVGYRRPPRANRFKPGQSGNPKGRPKGSKNFSIAIQAELDSRILATENGKRRKITKLDALAKQIVNKAVSGELRAISVLFNEMRQIAYHRRRSLRRASSTARRTTASWKTSNGGSWRRLTSSESRRRRTPPPRSRHPSRRTRNDHPGERL